MEVINQWAMAIEGEDRALNSALWNWATILLVALAGTNFLNFSWQIIPYSGSKGIYPAVKKLASLNANFPLWRLLLHFPFTWFRFLGGFSDTAIRAYPFVGMALCSAFCLIQFSAAQPFGLTIGDGAALPFPVQIILLWAIWFFHIIFSDLQLMPFPWHNIINESLLLLALSWTTCLSPSYGGGMIYPSIGVTAIRVLTFRVLFGFGKVKFMGAEWTDWKYIKPFLINIPCSSPVGVFLHRWAPDFAYGIGYLFFFVSECILPFAYFAPSSWWRIIACLTTLKLMVAIHITTNFGNFNILTAVLCLALPLPVTGRTEIIVTTAGPWWYGVAAGVAYWGLVLNMIGGMIVLVPFNSWISGGWHQWPSLLQIPYVKQFNFIFEVCFAWRACQPYGVFSPNISANQRQIPLWEGSRDGKTWEAYRFHYQPTRPDENSSFMCGRHPNLEFMSFYPIGAGFLQSSFGNAGVSANFESRLQEEVAKNLIAGGDATDLFKDAPFPKSNPPKYVRLVQLVMFPESKGSPNWWKVVRTQQEVATFSAETQDILMPKSWVQDALVDTEPATWVWRQRVKGRRAEIAKIVGNESPASQSKEDIQKYNDARALAALTHLIRHAGKLSPESKKFISDMKKCVTLEDCCNQRDRAGQYVAVPTLQREIHRAAMLLCDILITCGWPWFGENKPRMAALRKDGRWKTLNDEPFPVTIFHLYLYGLHLLANPPAFPLNLEEMKIEVLAQVECPDNTNSWYKADTPVDPAQVHDGFRLLVGMYPRTLRIDASANRRWSKVMSAKNTDMRGGDMILPGYQMYWRSLFAKTLPLPSSAADHGNAKLAATIPGNLGGHWVEEWRPIHEFSNKIYEFEFKGFSIGDHRLPSAEKMVFAAGEKASS